jgi:hypothetical protein
MYYQGNRVLLRFITDCVRSTAREWNNLTRARRNSLHRRAKASGVEGKFALDDVVELTWIMAVHDRRPRRRVASEAPPQTASPVCALVASSVIWSIPSVSRSAVAKSTGNLSIS